MNSEHEVTVEQEVADTKMGRPHVVILGAGASRQTCLNGDKNENKLPLMRDFTEVVEIKSMLKQWSIDPNQNFEEIFSDLYERNENHHFANHLSHFGYHRQCNHLVQQCMRQTFSK